MNFTHHSGGLLKIPKHDSIKHQVMKMGEETIEGVCEIFTDNLISISPYNVLMIMIET